MFVETSKSDKVSVHFEGREKIKETTHSVRRTARIKEQETSIAIHTNLSGSSSAYKTNECHTLHCRSHSKSVHLFCVKCIIANALGSLSLSHSLIDIKSHFENDHHHLYCFTVQRNSRNTHFPPKEYFVMDLCYTKWRYFDATNDFQCLFDSPFAFNSHSHSNHLFLNALAIEWKQRKTIYIPYTQHANVSKLQKGRTILAKQWGVKMHRKK